MLVGKAYSACDWRTDCQQGDSSPWGATNWPQGAGCWCLDYSEKIYRESCDAEDPTGQSSRILTGCVAELGTQYGMAGGLGICGPGVCIKGSCPVGEYRYTPPKTEYTLYNYKWSGWGYTQAAHWAMACRKCECPSTQILTQSCYDTNFYYQSAFNFKPACATCPTGYTCTGKLNEKTICPIGSYCVNGVKTTCSLAKAEHCTTTGMGAPVLGCDAGIYYSTNLCTACAVGTYLVATELHTVTACTACTPGTKQPGSDRTIAASCVACPPGTYSKLPQSITACYNCAYGSISGTVCGVGTYATFSNDCAITKCTGCTNIPDGSYYYSTTNDQTYYVTASILTIVSRSAKQKLEHSF